MPAATLRSMLMMLARSRNRSLPGNVASISRWRGTGTHAGPLQLPSGPLAPTGNHIDFGEIRIDRHAGDRIVESWFIPDRMGLWHQLGLLPSG